MWMGGNVPFGYRVENRKLVVQEPNATTVRAIFERFVRIGSATVLARQLPDEGVVAPSGKPFDKGARYNLLRHWGCSIVLCTATQPAVDERLAGGLALAGRELAPDPAGLARRLRRARRSSSSIAGRMRSSSSRRRGPRGSRGSPI
jgi:hypothetical protein